MTATEELDGSPYAAGPAYRPRIPVIALPGS